VRLTTPSDHPVRSFVVEAVDYDTRAPILANRVTLRFTALDDPVLPDDDARARGGADNA
jgi:hypothetical protein